MIVNTSLSVFAYYDNSNDVVQNVYDDVIDPDAIVYYMEGFPIKQSDVDENNIIKDEVIKRIENYERITSFKDAVSSNYVTIPSQYNNAIVKTTIIAPRYSQTNTTYYLTRNNGAKFTTDLDDGAIDKLVSFATGFIPYYGPEIALFLLWDSLRRGEVTSEIRKRTDNGKKVRINQATSNYGTYYGVFDWSGRRIETNKNYENGIRERIDNIQYK